MNYDGAREVSSDESLELIAKTHGSPGLLSDKDGVRKHTEEEGDVSLDTC